MLGTRLGPTEREAEDGIRSRNPHAVFPMTRRTFALASALVLMVLAIHAPLALAETPTPTPAVRSPQSDPLHLAEIKAVRDAVRAIDAEHHSDRRGWCSEPPWRDCDPERG